MTIEGEPVSLYVYDLSNGLALTMGRALTGRDVEGIWHTSLVLYGMEVFFGQGISIVSPPGTTHHGVPKKKLPCGVTHLDKETFLEYIENLRETYRAESYHLLEFNCNTFTNDVLGFLNGGSIPADIRNQPTELMSTPFGQQMRPMIEQMFVGRKTPSAGAAVNNIMPQLGLAQQIQTADDVPSAQSVASNLQICTSTASMRTLLGSSAAVAVMFTSPTCPPCNAIKPHFEALARKHASSRKRIEFVLVETHVGAGAVVARSAEFGGPVSATPTFVFFHKGAKVGECKGANRQELETQVGMLELAAYPPHPHTKLALPALAKLSKSLGPITFTSFPPIDALSQKLDSALSASSLDGSSKDALTKRVPSYLRSLPAPPDGPSRNSLPTGLLEAWLPATQEAIQTVPASAKFPIVDLVRLALVRDSARLASSATFVSYLPTLVSHLATDLDHDDPERPYLLTSLRLVSNALTSNLLTARLLASDILPHVTRLIIRALLDPQDPKMRSAGAGTAWSVVARVYAARVGELDLSVEKSAQHALGGEGGENGEEWEAEMASAILEALAKETESIEVVHRLTATLGLLLYQSPYADEIRSLLEVLDISSTLDRKQVQAQAAEKGGAEVTALVKDVRRLIEG